MQIEAVWRDARLRRALTCAAVGCWLALAVLSLVPGSERPHTGLAGQLEHLLAYAGAGLLTRLALRRTASRWQALAFSLAAAFFEICQIWIPGRSAAVGDWLASTAGALIGVAVARKLAHMLEPPRRRAGAAARPTPRTGGADRIA